ncbi:MAG: phosphopyruvate hydratase [Thermoprotei archaeon]
MEFDITYVKALQVLDSRGNPTVEVVVITEGGGYGRSIAPAGASRGRKEAVDLRDGGTRFLGMGVSRAVDAVNKVLGPALIGLNASNYRNVDKKIVEVDGTQNKSRIGGNACVATSLANIKAAADTIGVPLFTFLGGFKARLLPTPLMNIINGGVHAGNKLAFQEFMIIPVGADKFSEALRVGVEVYWNLKKFLKGKYGPSAINVGDEGGFAPPLKKVEEALEALSEAVKLAGYSLGNDVLVGVDAAASQFYDEKNDRYVVDEKPLSTEDLLDMYLDLTVRYPIAYLEDPFNEESPTSFGELRKSIKTNTLIIGDDLTVTREDLVTRYFKEGFIDGAIIKVNQVGTYTEAEDSVRALLSNGGRAIISHRSGETEDNTIAHIAVGLETGLIKTGAPARGERTAKYNELLRIEDYLGGEALFAGVRPLLK